MQACRDELTALKQLLRAAEAAKRADAARLQRQRAETAEATPEGRPDE
jgi:hypothetical protein